MVLRTLGWGGFVSFWGADRVGTRPVTVAGLGILVLGYLLVSGLRLNTPAWEYIARVACLGLGMGVFGSPNNGAIMGAVPRHQLGVACRSRDALATPSSELRQCGAPPLGSTRPPNCETPSANHDPDSKLVANASGRPT